MSEWNRNRLNVNFMHPDKEVGKVIVNGKIDRMAVAMGNADCNTKPYYDLPEREYRDRRGEVSRGDILATFVNMPTPLGQLECNTFQSRQNADKLCAISVLNGQGNRNSDTNWTIMQRLRIVGLAEMPNDDNSKELFNIAIGGTLNVRNNGDEMVHVNQPIIAYAPTAEEIKRRVAGGKNRTKGEEAGQVKLWFKPYNDNLHKQLPKQIYACLEDTQNQINLIQPYRKYCSDFWDSICSLALIMMLRVEQEGDEERPKYDADEAIALLALMGHSQYADRGKDTALEEREIARRKREELRATIFMPYSQRGKTVRAVDARLYRGDNLTSSENEINALQAKAASLFLLSTHHFTKTLDNLMVGEAKTSAEPGHDFTIQMKTYTRGS